MRLIGGHHQQRLSNKNKKIQLRIQQAPFAVRVSRMFIQTSAVGDK